MFALHNSFMARLLGLWFHGLGIMMDHCKDLVRPLIAHGQGDATRLALIYRPYLSFPFFPCFISIFMQLVFSICPPSTLEPAIQYIYLWFRLNLDSFFAFFSVLSPMISKYFHHFLKSLSSFILMNKGTEM